MELDKDLCHTEEFRGEMMCRDEKGIALVIALIVSLIVLILGGVAVYMTMQSSKMSGEFKGYTSSVAAAQGALNETLILLPELKSGVVSFPSVVVNSKVACLKYKLNTATSAWTASDLSTYCGCTLVEATDPSISSVVNYYDIEYRLGSGVNTYDVFVKFINTSLGNTNAAAASSSFSTGGTVSSKSGGNTLQPPPKPYLYTVVVYSGPASDVNNPARSSYIRVLYAY